MMKTSGYAVRRCSRCCGHCAAAMATFAVSRAMQTECWTNANSLSANRSAGYCARPASRLPRWSTLGCCRARLEPPVSPSARPGNTFLRGSAPRCWPPISRQSARGKLPGADLDKGGEEHVQVGIATRFGLVVVIARRELPDPIHPHPGGGQPVDDGFEPVAELDGRRHQFLVAKRPGHSPLIGVGHSLVLEVRDLRPPATAF